MSSYESWFVHNIMLLRTHIIKIVNILFPLYLLHRIDYGIDITICVVVQHGRADELFLSFGDYE